MKEKISIFLDKAEEGLQYFFRIIRDNIFYKKLMKDKTINEYKLDKSNQETKPFSMMSFNLRRDALEDGVHNWKYRKQYCADLMNNKKCDIICNQEVMPHMFKFLITELKDNYEYYGIDTSTGLQLHNTINPFTEGLTIFYNKHKYECVEKGRFWLSDKPNIPSRTWGNVVYRIAMFVKLKNKFTNEELVIVNTHFDHKSDEAIEKSAKTMAEFANKLDCEVFIAGDFNCIYNDDLMKPMNDVLHHNVTSSLPTFTGFKFNKKKIIDMIYTKKPYKCSVVKQSYNGHNISDHCPIIITPIE